MKTLVCRPTFQTADLKEVARWTNGEAVSDPRHVTEILYKAVSGELSGRYFLYGRGGRESSWWSGRCPDYGFSSHFFISHEEPVKGWSREPCQMSRGVHSKTSWETRVWLKKHRKDDALDEEFPGTDPTSLPSISGT